MNSKQYRELLHADQDVAQRLSELEAKCDAMCEAFEILLSRGKGS